LTDRENDTDRRWILGCVGIGIVLRLFRIGYQNIWIDESISLQLATYAEGLEFWRGLLIDIHGPFTSALLHGWVKLGQSEAWMRMLYAIPGVATIPLVYILGRRLLGRATGRLAALALALSPFHVWYSQEIRNYTWAMLWATGALILFTRIWDGQATTRTWVGLTALGVVSVLTNFSAVFLLISLSLIVLLRRPFSARFVGTWAIAMVAVGIVFLPWFVDWFQRIGGDRIFVDRPPPTGGVHLREASGFSPLGAAWAYWTFAFGYSLGPTLLELHLDRSWSSLSRHAFALAAGAAAIGAGAWLGVRETRRQGRLSIVLGMLLVPLLLSVFLAVREIKTFHPRYLISSFPIFVVLLAAGWSRPGRFAKGAALVTLAFALVALGQHYFHPAYAKEDSRSAARLILEEERPGDTVVVIYSLRPFRHYFSDTADGQARLHYTHKRYLRTDEELRAFIEGAGVSSGRVWLVLSRWWDVAPETRIRGLFEEQLREEQSWQFNGVKVTLYEPRA